VKRISLAALLVLTPSLAFGSGAHRIGYTPVYQPVYRGPSRFYGPLILNPWVGGLVYQEPPRRSPAFERIWAEYRMPQPQAAPVAIKGHVDRMPDYTPNPKMIENPYFKR
jgi:hypothetical protein